MCAREREARGVRDVRDVRDVRVEGDAAIPSIRHIDFLPVQGYSTDKPNTLVFYRVELEESLLKHSKDFYLYEANEFLNRSSISDYLRKVCAGALFSEECTCQQRSKVESILEFEKNFCEVVVHNSTCNDVRIRFACE